MTERDGKKESFEDLMREGVSPPVAANPRDNRHNPQMRCDFGSLLPPYSESGKDAVLSGSITFVKEANQGQIHQKTLRDMRSGKDPSNILDLHGLTAREAHAKMEDFLRAELAEESSVVDICHGKGAHARDGVGVLRTLVRHWLKESPVVLAFITPDNNEGMVRVRLKSLKKIQRKRHAQN